MAKYIRCGFCNEKIMFGQEAYHKDHCEVYCSIDCYFDDNGGTAIVDDHFANLCDCTVYDDNERKEAIREEIEKTKAEISNLTARLKCLEFDLKAYENS